MSVTRNKFNLKSVLMTVGLIGSVTLSGCAIKPMKYSLDSISSFTDTLLRPRSAPLEIQGPLTIDDVRMRTLSYNSEYARSQDQLTETIRTAGERGKDLLPQMFANSYGSWRSNTSASVGAKVDEVSSADPKDFYTAQDQALATSKLTTSWDLLEVGLSGYKANRRTINAYSKAEHNQYLCNKLMVDVENAYWRAVAFDTAQKSSTWLKSRVAFALELSQERSEEAPETRLQELMFQREIIDIYRWYQSLYRSLINAKPDLARLMNVPAGTNFNLESTRLPSDIGELASKEATDLISIAYKNRPEIRKSLYQADLTELKNAEDLWRHLPAMRLFLGGNQDTNSFLLNQDFFSAGASLSWDLLRLGQIKETKRKAKFALEENQKETEVLASAVMAQVMISREQVQKLSHDQTLAWKAFSVQSEITAEFREKVALDEQPETYLVKEELMRELVSLREQIANAELHTAKARLEQSVGTVPTCQPVQQDMQQTLVPARLRT